MWYPTEQWLNPFDFNKPFDVHLGRNDENYKDIISKLIDSKKNCIFVLYNELTKLIEFLESKDSSLLVNKIKDNKIKVIFISDDSDFISKSDLDCFLRWESFFNQKNVKIIFSNFYKEIKNFDKLLYPGIFIHFQINYLIKNSFSYNHLDYEKEYHFLSLNNKERPLRLQLFNFYKNLKEEQQNMVLCSFNFKNKYIEKSLFIDNTPNHPLLYDNNLLNFYKKSLFEILVETQDDVVTEKTYKPLLLGIPFILYSDNSSYQFNYFNNIGINIDYFYLKNKKRHEIESFMKHIFSLSIEDVKLIYRDAFKNAELNKTKIKNHIINIKTEVEKFTNYEENR
jgi:hypothetical protein